LQLPLLLFVLLSVIPAEDLQLQLQLQLLLQLQLQFAVCFCSSF